MPKFSPTFLRPFFQTLKTMRRDCRLVFFIFFLFKHHFQSGAMVIQYFSMPGYYGFNLRKFGFNRLKFNFNNFRNAFKGYI